MTTKQKPEDQRAVHLSQQLLALAMESFGTWLPAFVIQHHTNSTQLNTLEIKAQIRFWIEFKV